MLGDKPSPPHDFKHEKYALFSKVRIKRLSLLRSKNVLRTVGGRMDVIDGVDRMDGGSPLTVVSVAVDSVAATVTNVESAAATPARSITATVSNSSTAAVHARDIVDDRTDDDMLIRRAQNFECTGRTPVEVWQAMSDGGGEGGDGRRNDSDRIAI